MLFNANEFQQKMVSRTTKLTFVDLMSQHAVSSCCNKCISMGKQHFQFSRIKRSSEFLYIYFLNDNKPTTALTFTGPSPQCFGQTFQNNADPNTQNKLVSCARQIGSTTRPYIITILRTTGCERSQKVRKTRLIFRKKSSFFTGFSTETTYCKQSTKLLLKNDTQQIQKQQIRVHSGTRI